MASHLYTISLKKWFFRLCWDAEKGTKIKFQWTSPKKLKKLFWIINFSYFWWATLLTNTLYEPHGTFVPGFTLLLNQEGPKTPQSIWSLLSRGWNTLPGACSYLDLEIHFIQGIFHGIQSAWLNPLIYKRISLSNQSGRML